MSKGFLRHTASALCILAVAACATPTPYKAAVTPNGDGYTTQQIESNRFRISFRGNSLTNRQTVDTYMLYRAAEVTLQSGNDYFIIVNKDVDKNTAYENYADNLAWGWGGGWGWRRGFGGGYGAPKPAANPSAYDAHEVLNAIGPTIVRIAPAPGAPPAPPAGPST
jgi:hypothetical protein